MINSLNGALDVLFSLNCALVTFSEALCYLQTLVVWLEWVKGLGKIYLLKEALLCTLSICKRLRVSISYFLDIISQTSDIKITRSLLKMYFLTSFYPRPVDLES